MTNESAQRHETVTLANGVVMPTVAFGCAFGDWVGRTEFQGFRPELAWRAMTLALGAGYRAFDGAHVYGTESVLGDLLGPRFASGELRREDLFITTKLAHPNVPPEVNISHLRTWDANDVADIRQRVRDDMQKSLAELRVGYVDLLLMHWPGPFANEDAELARRARREVWETFVELHRRGAARAIGVSNFTVGHLKELAEAEVKPMVNQVEVHPYCRDPELESWCREQGIVVTAYAPFASGAFDMLKDPALVSIAEAHGVSTGQVVLRWHLQSGRTVLPKSSNPERMRQNLDLHGFALSADEMAAIDALGGGEPRRTCGDPNTIT